MVDISFSVAFVAGVLSFFSPCILPLVPGFLAYLAGLDLAGLRENKRFNTRIFLNTLCYVAGFTLVFTLAGVLLASFLGSASIEARSWMSRVGGLIVIFFGLSLLGVVRIPFLDQEHKLHVKRKASYVTSFLLGVAFAVGWTPCFGAVLGSIFTLAASSPSGAFGLLFAYSLGLAVPFLLAGTFYSAFSRFITFSRRYSRYVSIVLGVLLIVVGLLVFFNQFSMFGLQRIFDTWYLDRERELLDAAAGANLS